MISLLLRLKVLYNILEEQFNCCNDKETRNSQVSEVQRNQMNEVQLTRLVCVQRNKYCIEHA